MQDAYNTIVHKCEDQVEGERNVLGMIFSEAWGTIMGKCSNEGEHYYGNRQLCEVKT